MERTDCCEHDYRDHEQAPSLPKCAKCPKRKAVHLWRRA